MLNYFFPKSARLLHSRDFSQCMRHGVRRSGRYLHLHILKNQPSTRLGLTVARKYGKAVVRNRFKRRLREAFRLSQHTLPPGLHLNVRPLIGVELPTLEDIQNELLNLLADVV